MRLGVERVRMQVRDTTSTLPGALLVMAELGSLVKYRHFYTLRKVLSLCHQKNPRVTGQYGQQKARKLHFQSLSSSLHCVQIL